MLAVRLRILYRDGKVATFTPAAHDLYLRVQQETLIPRSALGPANPLEAIGIRHPKAGLKDVPLFIGCTEYDDLSRFDENEGGHH